MVARPFLTFIPLILTAGATLFIILVLLGGSISSSPGDSTYFLSADTSNIQGAPSTTHFTLWNVCNGQTGKNTDCGSVAAAFALQPQSTFNTNNNIPADFLNNANFYYYISRIDFAFYLIAGFFSAFGFLTGFLALCSRLGAGLASVLTFCALLADIVAAALMTVLWVDAKNAFVNNNMSASIGVQAFAFTWASVACLLISTIFFCCACCIGRKEGTTRTSIFRRKKTYLDNESAPVNGSF